MQSTAIEIALILFSAVLNGILIWLWQQMRMEIKQLKETRCNECLKQILEKASRTRVQELERRVDSLEKTPVDIAQLEAVQERLEKATDKLEVMVGSMGQDIAALKAINTIKVIPHG